MLAKEQNQCIYNTDLGKTQTALILFSIVSTAVATMLNIEGAFGEENFSFLGGAATIVVPETAITLDDTVAGNLGVEVAFENGTYSTKGARRTRLRGNLLVGQHLPLWDFSNDGKYFLRERSHVNSVVD